MSTLKRKLAAFALTLSLVGRWSSRAGTGASADSAHFRINNVLRCSGGVNVSGNLFGGGGIP